MKHENWFVAILPYLSLGIGGTAAGHVFDWPMWIIPACLAVAFFLRFRNTALLGGAGLGVAAVVGWLA